MGRTPISHAYYIILHHIAENCDSVCSTSLLSSILHTLHDTTLDGQIRMVFPHRVPVYASRKSFFPNVLRGCQRLVSDFPNGSFRTIFETVKMNAQMCAQMHARDYRVRILVGRTQICSSSFFCIIPLPMAFSTWVLGLQGFFSKKIPCNPPKTYTSQTVALMLLLFHTWQATRSLRRRGWGQPSPSVGWPSTLCSKPSKKKRRCGGVGGLKVHLSYTWLPGRAFLGVMRNWCFTTGVGILGRSSDIWMIWMKHSR